MVPRKIAMAVQRRWIFFFLRTDGVACWCLDALQRCTSDVLLSNGCLLSTWHIMSDPCGRQRAESCRHSTGTYVQNKASRTETRGFVSYTPAENKRIWACHALQRARIARRGPQPMCPTGLPASTTCRFAEKCSHEEMMSQKMYDNFPDVTNKYANQVYVRWLGRWSACPSRPISWVQVSPSACS